MHATTRRSFLATSLLATGSFMLGLAKRAFGATAGARDIFSYIIEQRGAFDLTLYRQLLGSAGEYKEGDDVIGAAGADQRALARELLGSTRIADLMGHPVHEDEISRYANAAVDNAV